MSSQSDAAPAEPIQLTDADEYADIVSRYDTVLVDFYADWCGPCQMMEPTIEALAEDTAAAVLKVDVDRFQALAGQHGVQGIPTLLVYADGEQAERMVGAQTGDALEDTVTGYTA
ncbi:thioredoxin family protein [Halonotius sp. F2-221B]|uniref:thioredoxin family protein n=1 Tax=Halonotius sp. F2-221B TaxID=2731620 RepID=UPI00398B50F1